MAQIKFKNSSQFNKSVACYDPEEVEVLLSQVRKEYYNKGVSDSGDVVANKIRESVFIPSMPPSPTGVSARMTVINIYDDIQSLRIK